MHTFKASPFVLAPQQERSRAALARIVDAASRVMARNGQNGFTMAEIAKEADLPVGNLYRRFKGKEEIVQAIKFEATTRLESTIEKTLAKHRMEDIRELIVAYTSAMAKAFAEDQALHQILFSQPTASTSLSEIGTAGRHRIFTNYMESLVPLLDEVPVRKRETAARVSFQITASAFLAKARGIDATLGEMSWTTIAREFGEAAILYLSAQVQGSSKTPDTAAASVRSMRRRLGGIERDGKG